MLCGFVGSFYTKETQKIRLNALRLFILVTYILGGFFTYVGVVSLATPSLVQDFINTYEKETVFDKDNIPHFLVGLFNTYESLFTSTFKIGIIAVILACINIVGIVFSSALLNKTLFLKV